MGSPAIDYDALARQHGGKAANPVDYDALARQHGGAQAPGAVSRFAEGTGIPGMLANAAAHPLDTARHLAAPTLVGPSDIKEAWDALRSIAQSSSDHFKTAMKASEDGDYQKATEHALYAIPGLGQQGEDIVQDLRSGNTARALGKIAIAVVPALAGEGAARVGPALERAAAGAADSSAGTFVKGGLRAVSPTLEDIPVVGKAVIKPAKAFLKGGQEALAEKAGTTQPVYTPPTAAGKPGVTQVPASAVRPIDYGDGSGHFGEQPPAVPDAPPPALTAQQQAIVDARAQAPTVAQPAPAPQVSSTSLADLADPTTLKAAALEQFEANRAARLRPTPAPPPLTDQQQAAVQAAAQARNATPGPPPETAPVISPEAAREAAQQRFAANQAARDPNSPENVIARIKALGQPTVDPPIAGFVEPNSPANPVTPGPAEPIGESQPISPRQAPVIPISRSVADLADPAELSRLAARNAPEHPNATANRQAQSTRVAQAMTAYAERMGYTAADLANLQEQNPAAFNAIAAKIDALTTGSAKQETPWRASTPNASTRTIDQIGTKVRSLSELAADPRAAVRDMISADAERQGSGSTETPAANLTARPGEGASTGAAQSGHPADTEVYIPGEDRAYPARYKLVELGDIQPSHNGQTFEPNPKYTLKNDRDYTKVENQGKIVEGATPAKFRPNLLITDNPDASNGPPLIDSQGNAIGGNGRTMILQRVYGSPNTAAADAYRSTLAAKAGQYGIDPAELSKFKQPVLIREIADEHLGADSAQNAVTDFNKSGTAALRPAERIIADSKRVSRGTLDAVSQKMEAIGPNATLGEVLRGTGGMQTYQQLVKDGVITGQETAAYLSKGQLTPEGQARISKLLLGRFFSDPAQLDTLETAIKNKVERVAAPLVKSESVKGWSLTDTAREALELIEDKNSFKRTDATIQDKQTEIGGERQFSREAIDLARILKRAKQGELVAAARAYAELASQAAEHERTGPDMFGLRPAPLTPAEAFEQTFGQLRPNQGRKAK